MTDKDILKKNAPKYTVCFNDKCQLHESCLRWQTGLHVPSEQRTTACINPHIAGYGTNNCPECRSDKPVRMPKGMIHFYENMPGKTERAIKADLIDRYTRVGYYKMRNGMRQITPEMEAEITEICSRHGWTEPPIFDNYVEELLW